MIASTGEDVPPGHSLRARLLIVEMPTKSMKWDQLSTRQKEAADGVYATAMAGFVQYIAGNYREILNKAREAAIEFRQQSTSTGSHRRTPAAIAELGAGLEIFLTYAMSMGALTAEESAKAWDRCWKVLTGLAGAQLLEQVASTPTERFRELLVAAVAAGHAHIADTIGTAPANASASRRHGPAGATPRGPAAPAPQARQGAADPHRHRPQGEEGVEERAEAHPRATSRLRRGGRGQAEGGTFGF